MKKVSITDNNGNVVAVIEVDDATTDEQITKLQEMYSPKKRSLYEIIDEKLINFQRLAPSLLRDLYVQNTLSGMTTDQSDALFEEFSDVILRLSHGAFPTALYRLSLKQPSESVSQEMLDKWKRTIIDYMT